MPRPVRLEIHDGFGRRRQLSRRLIPPPPPDPGALSRTGRARRPELSILITCHGDFGSVEPTLLTQQSDPALRWPARPE